MRRLTAHLALLCAVLAAGLVLPSAAGASSRQLLMMQDDTLVYRSGPTQRAETLDEMKALGADVVKLQLLWDEVAPSSKPANGADPAAYNWSSYDVAVQGILARGMRPLLLVGSRAPNYALGKRTRLHNGTYRPSAKQFRLFSEAAGRHFAQVRLWSIWNEPNLSGWLQPQRSKKGTPLSPSIYRKLYLAGHDGLAASGHGSDTILLGELMPLGVGSQKKIPPLDFLREFFCLNSRYKQIRGRAAKARACKRVRKVATSGLAFHPYTPRGGLDRNPGRGEASITTLRRVTKTLDALSRRGKLRRKLPVWLTEFGFQTKPPDPFQYSIKRVPGFMDRSEFISFRNGRVKSYSQYTVRDDKPGSGSSFQKWAGFQNGLRFISGAKKPGVYDAFRMPAYIRQFGNRAVEVFAGLRYQPGATATVYSRKKGGSYKQLGTATLNSAGYFRKLLRVSAPSKRRYKITIAGLSRTKLPARR